MGCPYCPLSRVNRRWRDRGPQGSAYVALPGRALVEMLAGSDWDRMVVDGADPTAFALTRSDAGRLVGAAVLSVGAGSAYRIGQPAQPPPDGLVEGLRSACEREPEVLEAYLYQFQIVERDEPPHLALGVRLSPSVGEPEVRRVAQSIVGLVEPARWGYEFLDFHPLDGELLEAARANGTALLQRD